MNKVSKTFDISEPVYFLKTACDNVTMETITNCFAKLVFEKESEISDFDVGDDSPISTLSALIKLLNEN